MDTFKDVIELIGKVIDSFGVAVIVAGIIAATVYFLSRTFKREGGHYGHYREYRRGVGRSILLGLEFIIAGDIIRTVAIDPTFANVGVLAVLIVIRSFLNIELQIEIEGRLPWQRDGSEETARKTK